MPNIRKLLLIFSILSFSETAHAQQNPPAENDRSGQPKMVVGVVVDQMRHEYLYRYIDQYGEGGFKRLLDGGFINKNAHYNYVPTYTGPGHASVYTGTTPAVHGIIGNNWYSRELGRSMYCAEDTSVTAVGSNSDYGQISPRNMLSTTIGDELKLSNNQRSKVVGISIKDRGAALPAGHLADGAYWYDRSNGHFITSTYYTDELAPWAKAFNNKQLPDKYLDQTWNTLLPIEQYLQSGPDDSPYEVVFKGKEAPVFPYDLAALRQQNDNFGFLTSTPFGNTILMELAKAAIEGENLGEDEFTDLLAVSFSTPDIVGHAFGPNSVELQDIYLRLDKDIENLLNYLDQEIGEGNYMLFLTADHAAAEVPQALIDKKVPAGYIVGKDMLAALNQHLSSVFGTLASDAMWVEDMSNLQVFLNQTAISEKKQNIDEIEAETARFLLQYPGVALAYTSRQIIEAGFAEAGMKGLLTRGFNQTRSGNVLISYEPAWIGHMAHGTTHGSGYSYDTHVPMLWYGWGIKPGFSVKYQSITDIAPTLSMLLNINFTNGSTGHPILEVFK